jgi:hypothetical protein
MKPMSAPEQLEQEAARGSDPESAELFQPRWAVVSFNAVEAVGLTYTDAAAKLAELDDDATPGLCIVTDDTAVRLIAHRTHLAG